jgi:predicted nucleic acid-binding protein
MRRIVVDTNVYIDWINDGRHGGIFFQHETVKYLSAVVVMELYAGARSRRDRKLLDGLTDTLAKADRVLVPTASMYKEAGLMLSELRGNRLSPSSRLTSLANDVLIALSARSIGAIVMTQNKRDFEAIQRIRPFRLTVVS